MEADAVPEGVLVETCRNLALALSEGLVRWSGALQWLAHYAESGAPEAREQLERYGREVGLPLLTMVRVAETFHRSWPGAPPELDLRPALPLAHALGESYVVLLIVNGPVIADRLPVVTMERTQQLFTPSVRTWLEQHLDEVPELRAAAGDGVAGAGGFHGAA